MSKARVWIELEKPKSPEEAEDIASKANMMMERLGVTDGYVWYWDEKSRNWTWGNHGGYHDLPDGGFWFNLDYLGRPE